MIQLINELFKLQTKFNVDATFSVFRDIDTMGLFIMIRLSKNGYKVVRCIEYKQWLEMSNIERDYRLSQMVRALNEGTEQDKEWTNA